MMRTVLSRLPTARPVLVQSRRALLLQTRAAKKTASDSNSLLSVPGIGRLAAQKLAERQIDGVDKLVSIYEEHDNDRDALVDYLAEAGIGGRWRKIIADWVASHDPITLCVEGNIGAGKSTYLNMVRAAVEVPHISQVHEMVEVVPEPVDMWTNLSGDNLLELFYSDPSKYAFAFQQYVLITRVQSEERTRNAQQLRLIERSVFCDRMVFVKAVHEARNLSNVELQVYDSWFNPMLSQKPNLIPQGFVYLRADTATCRRRIELRARQEEQQNGMTDTYLQKLGDFHESWLVQGSRSVGDGSLILGNPQYASTSMLLPSSPQPASASRIGLDHVSQDFQALKPRHLKIPDVPSTLKDKIVILDSELLRKSSNVASSERLHLVPALHIDCNDDVDIDDTTVSQERARLMLDFKRWLKAYRMENQHLLQTVQSSVSLQQEAELDRRAAELRHNGTPGGPGSLEVLAHAMMHGQQGLVH